MPVVFAHQSSALPRRLAGVALTVASAVLSVSLAGCAIAGSPTSSDDSVEFGTIQRPDDDGSAPDGANPAPANASGQQGGGDGWLQPPAGAAFDYQVGGAFAPPAGVRVVVREVTSPPAGLGYDICSVNGFQAAVREEPLERVPELLLRDESGEPITDEGWSQGYFYDISSSEKRAAVLEHLRPQFEACAKAGFHAIEVTDFDSFERAFGMIIEDDNFALARGYVALAHELGLAIAQKNTPQYAAELRAMGFDFVISDLCGWYDECDEYTAHYPVVFNIEHADTTTAISWISMCRKKPDGVEMIVRDPEFVAADRPGYFYRTCS